MTTGREQDGAPGTGASSPTGARSGRPDAPDPRHPSELEIRWRQARNAPPPVVRAVLANLAVATVAGVVLLLVDRLAGSEVGGMAAAAYVAVVLVSGSFFTYLWVELPTGASGVRRRSWWAGVLGLFAGIPIVYLALVIVFQVLRPLLP